MNVDEKRTIETLAEMVATPSVNPAFDAGGTTPGEAAIADLVARKLRGIGLDVEIREAAPGRPSVVGVLEGKGGGRSLMLNGHFDTVGPGGMKDPFTPAIENGRMRGRGSYDMKAGVAAILGAVEALVRGKAPLRGTIVVAAVADEEAASLGTLDVARAFKTDGAIVTEPTGQKLALAHRGFSWIHVRTKGFACHGSRYDLGVDANVRMGRVLVRLEALERDLASRPAHPLAGRPSLHAAILRGGIGPSIYAPECRLEIERRVAVGETAEGVLDEVRSIVAAIRAEDPRFEATVREALHRPPFEAARDGAVARAVEAAHRAASGGDPKVTGAPFWTDAAILREAGADTIVFGHDGAGAHEDEEWADLATVTALARTLAAAAADYAG